MDVNDENIRAERMQVILKEGNYSLSMKRLFSFTTKENLWIPVMLALALASGAHTSLTAYLDARVRNGGK